MDQVLQSDYKKSINFYSSDQLLQHYLSKKLSALALGYLHDKLDQIGSLAAITMDQLSMHADKNPPVFINRTFFGEDVEEISFHPAYEKLMDIAIKSEMFHIKWSDALANRFSTELHTMGFALGYIYAMAECGVFCPLCMTDGAARILSRHADPKDAERLIAHIASKDIQEFYSGAMFLTEKSGGSDVGANLLKATKIEGDLFELQGEKWFCSNVNADVILALGRTDEKISGTRGLSIFLVEKYKKDGKRNFLGIKRLKNKLGVRSMASAECKMLNTEAKLIGKEGHGFKIMTEMINLSRLYNSIAALSSMRRAMVEAFSFLKYRISFGKQALEHILIRKRMHELCAKVIANFYLTWNTIELLDQADNGDRKSSEMVRILTPMCKKTTAEEGVYIIREAMELMGGMGYIEDGIMPKILRDALVLPIWEGAGNIMTLDILRASIKCDGMKYITEDIRNTYLSSDVPFSTSWVEKLDQFLDAYNIALNKGQERLEYLSTDLFEKLAVLYKVKLLIEQKDDFSHPWIEPTLNYFHQTIFEKEEFTKSELPSLECIKAMMAWDIK